MAALSSPPLWVQKKIEEVVKVGVGVEVEEEMEVTIAFQRQMVSCREDTTGTTEGERVSEEVTSHNTKVKMPLGGWTHHELMSFPLH